jgi:hypothetical protein
MNLKVTSRCVRWRVVLVVLASAVLAGACRAPSTFDAGCDGALFGQPVAATGLDSTQCRSTCPCSGVTSRDFTADELAGLSAWTLSEPFPNLATNPFDAPAPERAQGVCAMTVEDVGAKRYRLDTFPDVPTAQDAGAILTHHDACGVCSTLTDLAVYARDRDLGAPVKKCGLDHFSEPIEPLVSCIEQLGFTHPCAQIWAFNVRHTQSKCLSPCLVSGPYHQADGTLGECLACDERESGPVFKAVAGRTRRNTGLASSICRPCAEARPVPHAYPL